MGKENKAMPTMADIARKAGVALSTVSYTLSGKRHISDEAKQRVYQAMEELGYQPNTLARALATKQTKIITLLYPSTTSGLGPVLEFVTSIVDVATIHGYAVLLWTSTNSDQTMNMTHQGFVDGAILMEVALHDPRVEMLKKQNIPFTMIGHAEDNTGISFVDLDFDDALGKAVDYLVESGHEHIALINQSIAMLERQVGFVLRARDAFYRHLQKHGLSGSDSWCEPNEQAGYDTTMTLWEQDPDISAFVLMTPWPSGGIIHAIADKGLSIPEDVSIISVFSPHLAEMTTPALSSVDFPFAEMGRIGTELLIQKLEGTETAPSQVLLKSHLMLRRSSGPHVK
jgi:DNA-binding LacI/PurR family transcriptional regulator